MKGARDYSALAIALAVLLLGWFFRPWFHGLVMGFYRNPALLYMFLALGGALMAVKPKRYILGGKNYTLPLILGGLFILSIVALILSSPFANTDLYKEYHPSLVTGELNLSTSYIRILPKFTAYRYAIDTIEYARYTLSDGHLTMLNGTLCGGAST